MTEQHGNSALAYASARGHSEVVRVLLEAGSNMESLNVNAWTPLVESTSGGHHDCVRLLINAGADMHVVSNVCDLDRVCCLSSRFHIF